jgi:hypothetical protein
MRTKYLVWGALLTARVDLAGLLPKLIVRAAAIATRKLEILAPRQGLRGGARRRRGLPVEHLMLVAAAAEAGKSSMRNWRRLGGRKL